MHGETIKILRLLFGELRLKKIRKVGNVARIGKVRFLV